MAKGEVWKRYTVSFKRHVVAEYEGGASAASLCRKYGIGSVSSVTGWVKEYGREGLRHEIIRIQTVEEADQLREVERERDLLQRAVADLTVRNLLLAGELQVYRETYGEVPAKKNGRSSSSTPTPPERVP